MRLTTSALSWRARLEGKAVPTQSPSVKLVVDGAVRKWAGGKASRVRDAFPIEALRAHVRDGLQRDIDRRDAALVAIGLRSMRRGGERADLRIEDAFFTDGRLRLRIRKSKVDQEARGFDVWIEPTGSATCPVALLKRYLSNREGASPYLFCDAAGKQLSTSAISAICRRMVERADLPVKVSSHSLRIGGATAAMAGGMSKERIMAIGGWASGAVGRYIRSLEPLALSASRRMGL